MSKLEEARDRQARLRDAAKRFAEAWSRGYLDEQGHAELDLRQAARDFAAAEMDQRLPPACDRCGRRADEHNVRHMFVGSLKSPQEWLRAGGLAKEGASDE